MENELGISIGAIKGDKTHILKRYTAFRLWQGKPVWYPCRNGFLRFGKDALETERGLHATYLDVPMVFIHTPLPGEYVVRVPEEMRAATGISNEQDLILLKTLKIIL